MHREKVHKKGAVAFTEGPFQQTAGMVGELEFSSPVFLQNTG
jgi:hypothetical protein